MISGNAARRLIDEFWHPIAHRSELASPRDFVRTRIGGEEAVAFHDGENVIVFDNLCPHRGARIFDGEAGNARFLCRYHGWSYSRGKVMTGSPGFLDPHCGAPALAIWQTEWLGDFLFASKQPANGLRDQLADFAGLLETISRDLVERSDINVYDYECDWRVALENALEPYHVGIIHPETLDSLKLAPGENLFSGRNSLWKTEVTNDRIRRGLDRLNGMFELDYQHKGYFSFYLFPFSMLSSTFGFSYSLQNFFPSDESEMTLFHSRFYRSRTKASVKPEVIGPFFENAARVNRAVFDEDHQICKRVPARSWRADLGFLTQSEAKVAHFRQSVAPFL